MNREGLFLLYPDIKTWDELLLEVNSSLDEYHKSIVEEKYLIATGSIPNVLNSGQLKGGPLSVVIAHDKEKYILDSYELFLWGDETFELELYGRNVNAVGEISKYLFTCQDWDHIPTQLFYYNTEIMKHLGNTHNILDEKRDIFNDEKKIELSKLRDMILELEKLIYTKIGAEYFTLIQNEVDDALERLRNILGITPGTTETKESQSDLDFRNIFPTPISRPIATSTTANRVRLPTTQNSLMGLIQDFDNRYVFKVEPKALNLST